MPHPQLPKELVTVITRASYVGPTAVESSELYRAYPQNLYAVLRINTYPGGGAGLKLELQGKEPADNSFTTWNSGVIATASGNWLYVFDAEAASGGVSSSVLEICRLSIPTVWKIVVTPQDSNTYEFSVSVEIGY